MTEFKQKSYSREEINIMIAEHLQICVEPICQEIGMVIEGLAKRLQDIESTCNTLITEMKAWKEENKRTIQ
jgi:hypothetical protein